MLAVLWQRLLQSLHTAAAAVQVRRGTKVSAELPSQRSRLWIRGMNTGLPTGHSSCWKKGNIYSVFVALFMFAIERKYKWSDKFDLCPHFWCRRKEKTESVEMNQCCSKRKAERLLWCRWPVGANDRSDDEEEKTSVGNIKKPSLENISFKPPSPLPPPLSTFILPWYFFNNGFLQK